jgi:hypothetical protein
MNKNILVSITSIPSRLPTAYFKRCLESILSNETSCIQVRIVLHLPEKYHRFGPLTNIPEWLRHHPRIIIHHPPQDYGPATKLLGLSSFITDSSLSTISSMSSISSISYLCIMDDDILYRPFLFSMMQDAIDAHSAGKNKNKNVN